MSLIFYKQLFRRVAAALPGMDSTENKPPEDSILYDHWVKIDTVLHLHYLLLWLMILLTNYISVAFAHLALASCAHKPFCQYGILISNLFP